MNRIKKYVKGFILFYTLSAAVGFCALLGLCVVAASISKYAQNCAK